MTSLCASVAQARVVNRNNPTLGPSAVAAQVVMTAEKAVALVPC